METEDLLVLVLTQKRSFIRGIIKNSFELLTIITKSSILNEIGFLDLPLTIIEKFDLSFVLSFVFTDCWPAQMPPKRDKKWFVSGSIKNTSRRLHLSPVDTQLKVN